jgi:pilus assembly protein Flp/PilA
MVNMTKFWMFLQAWVASHKDEDEGAAMVEYGLLLFFIAIAVIAVLVLLGPAIADLFQQVLDAIS